jgi:hypothetical protein
MAISTFKTFLMHKKEVSTYEKTCGHYGVP